MIDIKQWLSDKSEKLASERYDCSFYELTENQQRLLYAEVVELWKDYLADQIDYYRELTKMGVIAQEKENREILSQ